MSNMSNWRLYFKTSQIKKRLTVFLFIVWLLAGCSMLAPQTATPDVVALSTAAVATVYAELTLSPVSTPTPSLTPLPSAITDEFGVPMVLVPAGPFLMGLGENNDSTSYLEITIGDYYIDKYEVTNASYRACVESGACAPPYDDGSYTHESYHLNPDFGNYPVLFSFPHSYYLDEYDLRPAETHCNWRRAHLVTEIEWEKAMRGTDGRAYPWGNDQPDGTRANLCDSNCYQEDRWSMNDGFLDVAPVGSFPAGASPYGAMDMVGNVQERVIEVYELREYREVIKRAGEFVGGAYDTGPSNILNATYLRSFQSTWFTSGFRCAKQPAGEPISVMAKLIGPTLTPTLTPTVPANISRQEDGMLMVYVPGGTFEMGSESGNDDESPIHTVSLDAFWMDEHEVTNAMYKKCVDAGACKVPSDLRYYNSDPNYPAVYVDWSKANAYCEWAGGVSIGSITVRLPTEAEWEYAARGGLEGKTYPWGSESPVCTPGAKNGAQFASCSINSPIDVKTFQPNGYGLYDLVGNVWEWVNDWYGDYPSGKLVDPTGPDGGIYRVIRGGSWLSEDALSVSFRDSFGSDTSFIGFRCLRSY